ncbi:MAG: tRNA pseudouridine(13) synthase TruD [Porticoccaceae bacterium]
MRSSLISLDCYKFDGLLRLHGESLGKASYRNCPEDFIVDELIDFTPADGGEHLLLHIKKRDQNTQWVAGLLAELAGIDRRSVGFCGLKDRFAVTTQWFSLHLPGRNLDIDQLAHADFQILSSARHNKKLRRGMHAGNRFSIVLRDFAIDPELLEQRLELIQKSGVPNYFAEQRFGWDANNLVKANELIDQGRLKGNRNGTGIYLSAARSWLFNLLLDRYLGISNFNVIDTGALWGRGRSSTEGSFSEHEQQLLSDWASWCHALEHAGLQQQRRPFILQPQKLSYKAVNENQFKFNFELPNGGYATAVLREIAELFRHEIARL